VLMTSCLLSHESSLDFGYITLRVRAILYRGPGWSICEALDHRHEGKQRKA
jgi:hypothetical protein